MCCPTRDPVGSLRWTALMLIILGVLGFLVSPTAICAFVAGACICGSTDLRALKLQLPCAKVAAILGIVFAAIQLFVSMLAGMWIIANVEVLCTWYSTPSTWERQLQEQPQVQLLLKQQPQPQQQQYQWQPPLHHARALQILDLDPQNTETCNWASDGLCDDGGEGAQYNVCPCGTDLTDCGERTDSSQCDGSCQWPSDGLCDDGGPGAQYADCACGTDVTDCGWRTYDECYSSNSPPPPSPLPPGLYLSDGYASTADSVCGWVTAFGWGVVIFSAIYHLCVMVTFTFVLIRGNQVLMQRDGGGGRGVPSMVSAIAIGTPAESVGMQRVVPAGGAAAGGAGMEMGPVAVAVPVAGGALGSAPLVTGVCVTTTPVSPPLYGVPRSPPVAVASAVSQASASASSSSGGGGGGGAEMRGLRRLR